MLIIEPLDISESEIYKEMRTYNGKIKHLRQEINENNYTEIFRNYVNKALVIDLAYRVESSAIIE